MGSFTTLTDKAQEARTKCYKSTKRGLSLNLWGVGRCSQAPPPGKESTIGQPPLRSCLAIEANLQGAASSRVVLPLESNCITRRRWFRSRNPTRARSTPKAIELPEKDEKIGDNPQKTPHQFAWTSPHQSISLKLDKSLRRVYPPNRPK